MRRIDKRFDSVDQRLDVVDKKIESQFTDWQRWSLIDEPSPEGEGFWVD
jgi:hypothetical protein